MARSYIIAKRQPDYFLKAGMVVNDGDEVSALAPSTTVGNVGKIFDKILVRKKV